MKAGALVQWLKLPVWKVRDRGFEPHAGFQVSKKQNVSSLLTRKDSILWGASVTERYRARPQTARARILNPVSGEQCHFIHLAILSSPGPIQPICTQRWPKAPFISFSFWKCMSEIKLRPFFSLHWQMRNTKFKKTLRNSSLWTC